MDLVRTGRHHHAAVLWRKDTIPHIPSALFLLLRQPKLSSIAPREAWEELARCRQPLCFCKDTTAPIRVSKAILDLLLDGCAGARRQHCWDGKGE